MPLCIASVSPEWSRLARWQIYNIQASPYTWKTTLTLSYVFIEFPVNNGHYTPSNTLSLESFVMAKLSSSDIHYQLEHLHDSKIPLLLVSQIICFVLAVTAVILRLVSRRLNKASIQSDDYMILIALVKKQPSQLHCVLWCQSVSN